VRILDLFCGIGGLSLGFLESMREYEVNGSITGFDINRNVVMIYNMNLYRLGGRAHTIDVLRWKPRGEYDGIIGGPPCQPYSFANVKRKGTLHPYFPTLERFFYIIRVLKPKFFVMENVKGLISRKFIDYFKLLMDGVREYYEMDYRLLNMFDYGIPQTRKRVFLIGFREDLGLKPVFPKPLPNKTVLRDIVDEEIPDEYYDVSPKLIEKIMKWKPRRIKSLDNPSPTITGATYDKTSLLTVLIREDDGRIRYPTINEVKRIQGFPDWFKFPSHYGRRRIVEYLGESVPPRFSYLLGKEILNTLSKEM